MSATRTRPPTLAGTLALALAQARADWSIDSGELALLLELDPAELDALDAGRLPPKAARRLLADLVGIAVREALGDGPVPLQGRPQVLLDVEPPWAV